MKKISLILSDIDGTLMTDKGSIPSELDGVLDALVSLGLKFVVASGRQINNLYALFQSHVDELYFIAQNGAVIAHGRQLLYEKRMNLKAVEKCLSLGRQMGVFTMLYTDEVVMVEDNDPEFLSFLEQHQVEYILTDNLNAYANETYKLSYFKKDKRMSVLRKNISIPGVNVFYVNDLMVDLTNKDTDKGNGVRRLKRLLGVRKNEIIAFGDSENDLAMFSEAGQSFAVNNAPLEVKEIVSGVIPSNNESGVIVTLKRMFNLN